MKIIYFLTALMLALGACSEKSDYKKMYESIVVFNHTPDTLLIKTPPNTTSDSTDINKILSNNDSYIYIKKDIYDLWMTKKQLTDYFRDIEIKILSGGDTLEIDKSYYSAFDSWTHENHIDDWFGSLSYYNQHKIIIDYEMYANDK